jgi:hypothetical protein
MAVAPLFLNESDLAPFIDMADASACLEDAFRRKADPSSGNVPRSRARVAGGVLNLLGAVDGANGVFRSMKSRPAASSASWNRPC